MQKDTNKSLLTPEQLEFNPVITVKGMNGDIIETPISKPQKIAIIRFLQSTKISEIIQNYVNENGCVKLSMRQVYLNNSEDGFNAPYSLNIKSAIKSFQQGISKLILSKSKPLKLSENNSINRLPETETFEVIGDVAVINALGVKIDYLHCSKKEELDGKSISIKLLKFGYITGIIRFFGEEIVIIEPKVVNPNKTFVHNIGNNNLTNDTILDDGFGIGFGHYISLGTFLTTLNGLDLNEYGYGIQYVENIKCM